jgi:hypothetical protein
MLQTPHKCLKFGWLQIWLVIGILPKPMMQTMSNLVLVLVFFALAALSIGKVNCKQKLRCRLQKPIMLQWHWL